ncbi:MAG: tetratricopeptide repeat protein [Gemmatimonadota bacterium]|nr:MAG: tetratricopeptide repeat protein [Gemmatimonadota bacterium]
MPICEMRGRQLAFADRLLAQEDYNLAVLEYQRFLFNFPMDSLATLAKYKLGLCYMGCEKWDQALKVFKQITDEEERNKFVEVSLFSSGSCFSRKGEFDLARIQYHKVIGEFPRSELADDAQFMLALTYIDDCLWLEAADEFMNLPRKFPQSPFVPLAERLALESASGSQLPHRSAVASGILSAVIPGAGQVWCGRVADGFFSLLLTGTFTYFAIKSYQDDKKTSACFLGFLGFSFYTGNIYGAVNSARKYNSRNVEQFQSRLKMEAASAYK